MGQGHQGLEPPGQLTKNDTGQAVKNRVRPEGVIKKRFLMVEARLRLRLM